MPLSDGDVVRHLARLSPQSVADLVKGAERLRGALVDHEFEVYVSNVGVGITLSRKRFFRALRSPCGTNQLRHKRFRAMIPCECSALDVAILAGEPMLARALRAVGVQMLAFQGQEWTFIDLFGGEQKLTELEARRLEAALLAGVEFGAFLPRLLHAAIGGHQRKAAMLLKRHGAEINISELGNVNCLHLDVETLSLVEQLGYDLRAARPGWAAVEFWFWRYFPHVLFFDDFFPEPPQLLEMVIYCRQTRTAERLAASGCDAGRLSLEFLRVLGPDAVDVARRVSAIAQVMYQLVILQLSGWWHREGPGAAGGRVVAHHACVVELIAEFALAVPLLGELRREPPPPRPAPAPPGARAAAAPAREPGNAAEVVVVASWEHEEPAAEIHPAEAAAVVEQQWASGVAALCEGLARPRHDGVGIVGLRFGRDPAAFHEAVLASPPSLRALERGEDVKPAWASGAFVLVPECVAREGLEEWVGQASGGKWRERGFR
ncbi:unnamed protein product [Prorocentrum cordatum]|uniref:Uncharacterized protein n=1 Tax=Prorocentrum cordatum TaxID=2364126 RepID=A0ABN9YBS0_9DINO|nr:unnamed protein product [Polarella glacialis]